MGGAKLIAGAGRGGAGWGPLTLASRPFFRSQPRVSASLQDRMVLLVMGNIINWSL